MTNFDLSLIVVLVAYVVGLGVVLFVRLKVRFSVRALLVATTLVAVGLGLTAYMLGK